MKKIKGQHERKKLYHLILGLTEALENGLQETWSNTEEQGFIMFIGKQIHLKAWLDIWGLIIEGETAHL